MSARAGDSRRARQVQGPVVGYQEAVVVHDVKPDADGWVRHRWSIRRFEAAEGSH